MLIPLISKCQGMKADYYENRKLERIHTIYPLNIGFTTLFFDYSFISYQIAYGQKVNQMDQILFGIKYHQDIDYPSSKAYGFELQYRFNFNKDSNVEFKSKSYWSPYFEYSNFGRNDRYFSEKTMINVGVILVNKLQITNEIILDLFYGLGLSSVNYNNSRFGDKYLSFKIGIQLGFAF